MDFVKIYCERMNYTEPTEIIKPYTPKKESTNYFIISKKYIVLYKINRQTNTAQIKRIFSKEFNDSIKQLYENNNRCLF